MTKLNGSLKKIWLEPSGRANPKALKAIREADAIVIGPGGFYTAVVTNLLVRGIPEAIRKSRAKKIFVCNLMTKKEHTRNYSVADYTAAAEKYLGEPVEIVVYNSKKPSSRLLRKYAREGDTLTSWDKLPKRRILVAADLLSKRPSPITKIGTPSKEASLVRHDPSKLAKLIATILKIKP